MNGKKEDNSSFLKGATRGRPGKVLSKWRRKPHLHRALIRGAVFWPLLGVLILFTLVGKMAALLALAFSLPFLGLLAWRKGRLIFFSPFTLTDAASGVRSQQWILRNKWRRLIRRQEIPGLIRGKGDRIDPELPPEVEEAVRASLNMNELKGKMPITRVTRYKRKGTGTK